MKLTIEKITPYLPYGLKFYVEHIDGTVLEPWELTIDTNLRKIIDYQNKPILRPLSDLEKLIKVDGDIFIPKKLLIDKFGLYSIWGDNIEFSDGYDVSVASMTFKEYHSLIEKLFEWHFDIFDLIKNKLAINYNTLQK